MPSRQLSVAAAIASLCCLWPTATQLVCHGFTVMPSPRNPMIRCADCRLQSTEWVHDVDEESSGKTAPYSQSKMVSVWSAMLSVTLMLATISPASVAAMDATVYNHDYGDPFHPLCKRRIEVSVDGKSFHYSGTAVGPKDDPVRRGCSVEEIATYKLRRGAFDGLILANGKISAGDGIHEGEWEPAGTATTNLGYENVDGIRWNDGNKWFVVPKEEW